MTSPNHSKAPTCGLVQVQQAEVTFRSRGHSVQALAPISLSLQPASFTSVIGPSGCGKTTLLNAIAGFTPPTQGSIRLDGHILVRPGPEVGVMFQQYALFPWFSAQANVEFALKRFQLSKAERQERACHWLAQVGLAGKEKRYPAQLSGGMRQRVALARTLAAEPKVLLMDEPFGALDAQTRLSMQELLLQIWEAHRITVLFITHDIDEALLLSDRIVVMSPASGRFLDDLAIERPRPRAIEAIDAEYVQQRNHLLHLLRHR